MGAWAEGREESTEDSVLTESRAWGLGGMTSVGSRPPAGTAPEARAWAGVSLPEAWLADPAGKSAERKQ